jgi:pSer/pThr/pTyr-binding forkhead associated (FHA) protein
MIEVVLTYSTEEGSQEIALTGEKASFGRGSEAEYRFEDDGLSRLHATVYREGERVWIVDENSLNGTFVNGEKVRASGTILENGDVVKIGHYTKLKVRISEEQISAPVSDNKPDKIFADSAASENSFGILPLVVTAFAVLIIGVSAIFIGFKFFGTSQSEIVYKNNNNDFETPESRDNEENKTNKSPTPKPEKTTVDINSETNTALPELPANPNKDVNLLPENKKYQQLGEDEKNKYISVKAEKVAQIIGNQKSEPIPPEAVQEIKKYVGGYVSRLRANRKDDCSQGGWISSDFLSVLERASRTSPFIIRSFNAGNIEPQLGIYVAMIESEHCPCLTSTTGAKGMFQFLASSAPDYGLNPEQRCEPEPAARAAANYLKSLIGRYGTAPDSVPLAIASYNSGQGNLSKNLDKVLLAESGQNRSFWTLVANKNLMEGSAGKQFSNENVKYVPKFFATAIIGENPQDFGINMKPLSLYTK